ncbi:lysylphosphatidylglycerol synthase transmembrane domain-containing protein [Zhouia sp. PK063]|uniref:lysylphosphatidylglycerol synthase transmembrane domain-containing protein n=1 Tax=Zhouia sp. PK063 TaxID=3373602 RepID=UPI00379CB571
MEKKTKKALFTALKIVISIGLIYFILKKIDVQLFYKTLRAANPWFLLLAIIFFIISKVIAALRLNVFFKPVGIHISHKSNFKLYLLGMFYNLFLPGGIGGDAYKAFLLNKKFNVKTKKIVAALFLDRLSGLLLIFTFALIIALNIDYTILHDFHWLLITGIPLSIIAYYLFNKIAFKTFLNVIWSTLGYAALVQAFQLISLYFIMKGLYLDMNYTEYLFIFMISSIVSVIPLTIGGIGSRELTFFYGASFFKLDENISISISIIFFMITALISLLGIYFHLKKINIENDQETA